MGVFDKYIFVNTNEYKADIKQVSGSLQIDKLSVTAKTQAQLHDRLNNCLEDVLSILSDFNEKIDNNKEKSK